MNESKLMSNCRVCEQLFYQSHDATTQRLIGHGAALVAGIFGSYEITLPEHSDHCIAQSFCMAGIVSGAVVGGACGWVAGTLYKRGDIIGSSLLGRKCVCKPEKALEPPGEQVDKMEQDPRLESRSECSSVHFIEDKKRFQNRFLKVIAAKN